MAAFRWTLGNGRLRAPEPLPLRLELLERHYARVSRVGAERHGLAEDVHRQHALRPRAGAQQPPLFGEALAGLHVEVVLVTQTAEQPAAAARDLGRIERQVLILVDREADRPQLRQPAGAAVLAAAAPYAVEPLGLVSSADLTHLDPRGEQARQGAHQRAAIHALLGREIHEGVFLG